MIGRRKIYGRSKNFSSTELAWQRFRKNRTAVWAMRLLYVLIFIALFSPFIANDKPFYCKIDGKARFPIFKEIGIRWGLTEGDSDFFNKNWKTAEYEKVIWPPIPYTATAIDHNNLGFVSPLGDQNISSNRFRHRLGTDQTGRDVAAGMVAGTRVAMLVGIIAMFIATLIGLLLGSLAGYFGDDGYKTTRGSLIAGIAGLFFGVYYGFFTRAYALSEAHNSLEMVKSIVIFLSVFFAIRSLKFLLNKIPLLSKKVSIPIDFMVMRMIEIFRSIPGLLLLLAIIATIPKPSVYNVMVIIGFIAWPNITRYVRGEMLRIRELDYITAGKALGYSDRHIIMRHALPNAMGPVLVAIAFGIASAILAEATLSFLGIGVSVEDVTWGSLLNVARSNFSAWWLAIFPGFAIFITVTVFNLIGDGLQDVFDPKLKDD